MTSSLISGNRTLQEQSKEADKGETMEMQSFARPAEPVHTGRLSDRSEGGRLMPRMRPNHNYELARSLPDRGHPTRDMAARCVSASSGYGTREDSSSCEDIALRSFTGRGPSRAPDQEYPYNTEVQLERNGNYYSTVKPLVTVVKPKAGMRARARIPLPPSPSFSGERFIEDDNYNLSKESDYRKLEVNIGDMLDRLQTDLVGLRDSLKGEMIDAEPLLVSSINTAKSVKTDRTYEELELPCAKKASKSEYSKPKLSFRQRILQDLTGPGKHGFRVIFRRETSGTTRFLWLLLFACCLGALAFQLWDRVSLFTAHPTHVMVDKRYVEKLSFPAVTICSLNMFRLTKIVKLDLYGVAHALLHTDTTGWDARTLAGKKSLEKSYRDFLHDVAHQKVDLIESCSWYGRECGPVNFSEIITDHGLCFTFHPTYEAGQVQRAGPNAGLSMLLNVEHYEYLFGRKSSVGVRVSVHDPGVLPEIEAKGVNVPVGSFTTLMIQKATEHHQPSTLIDCKPASKKAYNRSVCLADYEDQLIVDNCTCTNRVKKRKGGTDSLRPCSAKDYFDCISKVKAKLNENKRFCACPPYCDFTEYDISISEAGLPVYAAEGRLQRLNKDGNLEKKFQKARDIYHRSDKVLLEHDIDTLDRILIGFADCETNISEMSTPLQGDSVEYRNAFSELKEALELLNSTSRMHYDNFYQSSHVAFCQETVTKHIEDNMDDIIQAESVIDDIRNHQFSKANETLWKIRRKLDRLVTSRREAWFSPKYSGFFVELTKGIQRFKDDLLDGYGQNFREFHGSKEFYNAKIETMLNLTKTITDTLLENYGLISNVTRLFTHSFHGVDKHKLANNLNTKLTKFFEEIKHLKQDPLPRLFNEMDEVAKSYAPRREHILEMSDRLVEIGPYLTKIDNVLNGFFVNVQTTLINLQSSIKDLETKLKRLAGHYNSEDFQKTELAEKINDDGLKSKVSAAESFLLQLRTSVSNLLETGSKMLDLLQPISHRLIDFNVLDKRDKVKLLQSLRFTSLEEGVESLSQNVEEQLSILNDLQTELDDYHRGSRLNGKFYLNNFLQLEVYFPELAETIITHEETYGLIALACDIGSSLALYLGISLLTVFGLLDLVVRSLFGSGGSSGR